MKRLGLIVLLCLLAGCQQEKSSPPVASAESAGVIHQDPAGFKVWFPSQPTAGKCALDNTGSYLAVSSDPRMTISVEAAARQPSQILGNRRWAVFQRGATAQGLPCLDFAFPVDTERRWLRLVFPGRGIVSLEVAENPARAKEQLWTNFLTPIRQVDNWGHFYRQERDRFWSSFEQS